MDLSKPQSRSEMFLGAISGDYTGELPEPNCRMELYLKRILENGTGGSTPDLSAYAKIQYVNDAVEKIQAEIDKLKQDNTPSSVLTLFSNDGTYGEKLYVSNSNTVQSLSDFIQTYPAFCSAENDFVLNYGYDIFGWDTAITAFSMQDFSVNTSTKISMAYISGATEDGKLYLVSADGITTANEVYSKMQNADYIELSFQWLSSAKAITTLTECNNVSAGNYYLAWIGRSNNSHPKIENIQILEV